MTVFQAQETLEPRQEITNSIYGCAILSLHPRLQFSVRAEKESTTLFQHSQTRYITFERNDFSSYLRSDRAKIILVLMRGSSLPHI
jgi:hypothetical protein